MIETNYCAHAVENLNMLIRSFEETATDPKDVVCIKALHIAIISGQKFRVPDYGKIIDLDLKNPELIRDYLPEFRLPYPITILEYEHPNCAVSEHGMIDFNAVIVCAIENRLNNTIVVTSMYRTTFQNTRMWVPTNFGGILHSNGDLEVFATTTTGDKWLQRTDLPRESRTGLKDIKIEALSVIRLMAALSCSNIQTAEIPAPDRLNLKRTRSGKQPFFSYRVLLIGEPSSHGKPAGGSHASPRVHLRRGHIRRLPNKRIWVNSSIVGNKALGLVEKSYLFRTARAKAKHKQDML